MAFVRAVSASIDLGIVASGLTDGVTAVIEVTKVTSVLLGRHVPAAQYMDLVVAIQLSIRVDVVKSHTAPPVVGRVAASSHSAASLPQTPKFPAGLALCASRHSPSRSILCNLLPEPQRRIVSRLLEVVHQLLEQLDREPLLAGSVLEQQQGADSLPVNTASR